MSLHRKLAEEKLGRKLIRGEVVHHINGDHSDNRMENLAVMMAREHARLHRLGVSQWTTAVSCSFRVTAEMFDRLRELAKTNERSVSDEVRIAVRNYLKSQGLAAELLGRRDQP